MTEEYYFDRICHKFCFERSSSVFSSFEKCCNISLNFPAFGLCLISYASNELVLGIAAGWMTMTWHIHLYRLTCTVDVHVN